MILADLNNWRKQDRACDSGFLSESVLRFPVENLQEGMRTHHLGFCARWDGSPRKNRGELGQLLLGRVLSSSVPAKQQLQWYSLFWNSLNGDNFSIVKQPNRNRSYAVA